MQKYLLVFFTVLLTLNAYGASKLQEGEVPRTAYKDAYKYIILEDTKKATLHQVTIQRLSFNTIVYIKAEINCPSRYFRETGHNAKSPKAITTDHPTQWYKPVVGSIEFDIVSYVCR